MMNLEAPHAMAAMSMPIPDGDPGTAATIAQMARLIDLGSKDPIVHETAARILRSADVRGFDWPGEARAIYNWVLRNIRFTRDIRGKETLHAAPEILRLGIGDCDDFTILMCALLRTVGMKCRIITISSVSAAEDPERPFTHVYPEVSVGGRWIPVDAARRSAAIGKSPQNFSRKRAWNLEAPGYEDIGYLNGLGKGGGGHAAAHAGSSPASPAFLNPVRQMRRMHGLGRGSAAGAGHGVGRFAAGMVMTGRGLQRLGFDWGAFGAALPAITTGTANIITASRANPINLFPTTGAGATARSPYVNYTGPGGPFSAGGAGLFSGISSTTVLLLGFGLIVVMGMRR